jgi:hypothetical protein
MEKRTLQKIEKINKKNKKNRNIIIAKKVQNK